MTTITAGIRELKNNLSSYLRRVAAGERILVTDHGRVVAELRPPSAPPQSRFDRLVAEGVIRPPAGKGDPFASWPPPGSIKLPPGTVAALLEVDRKDWDER